MTFWKRISGAIGLVLLLTSPLTFVVSAGSWTLAVVKALAGTGLLFVYFQGRMGMSTTARSSDFRPQTWVRKSYVLSVASGIGAISAVVGFNILAHQNNIQWDITRKKIFTLSPQTQRTLASLANPVEAIAFFPANHPNYNDVEQILKQYASVSQLFRYRFIDARKNPQIANRYNLKPGETPLLLVQGERQASLDLVGEQELTNALLKLNSARTYKIYFTTGHGEWALQSQELSELAQSLRQEGYSLAQLSLVELSDIPSDATAVVVVGARAPFLEKEKELLSQYLLQGGRLLYFAEAFAEPGLDSLFSHYAIQVDNGVVADDVVNPQNPYQVVTRIFSEHPMTRLLKQMGFHIVMSTARSLSVLRQGFLDGVQADPVALTFPSAWVESTPEGLPKLTDGEKSGALPLAVASKRPIPTNGQRRFEECRMVVFGDSEFLLPSEWGHEGNRNLVLNAFAWASSQVEQLTIRPPDRDLSTIDIDETKMPAIRFWLMDVYPFSLLAIGLAIWLKRRSL